MKTLPVRAWPGFAAACAMALSACGGDGDGTPVATTPRPR